MKRTRRLGLLASGIALILVGSGVWGSRLDYSVEERLQPLLPTPFISVDAAVTSDLSAACDSVKSNGGWIIFLIWLSLTSDETPRTFLQTAPEPYGLFVEYDPGEEGLLRLGLGLGPEKWNTALPLRHIRRNERLQLAIGVTSNETRVMGNLIDERINCPAQFLANWRCDAFTAARADKPTPAGINCNACTTSISYATGASGGQYEALMNSLRSNVAYNFRRIIGTVLILCGCYAVLKAMRRNQCAT